MVEAKNHNQHSTLVNDRTMFGFWVYLMTDLLMFSVLFAVYAVLRTHTVGGESGNEIFNLNQTLAITFILLTSSFTSGVGMVAARRNDKSKVLMWFGATLILGLAFLGLEIREFINLYHEGLTLQTNAFLSSFYALVGTHGLHIFFGLIWMISTLYFVNNRGLNNNLVRKISMLSLYWHFLDIVWIFIFTIVYLGAFV